MTPKDEETYEECRIAAMLTVAVVGAEGSNPVWVRKQYALMLEELRMNGGAVNPSAI